MKHRIQRTVSVLVLWPALAFAQATGTGIVTGRVIDVSGGVAYMDGIHVANERLARTIALARLSVAQHDRKPG